MNNYKRKFDLTISIKITRSIELVSKSIRGLSKSKYINK